MKKVFSRVVTVLTVLIFLFAASIFAIVLATRSDSKVPSICGYSFLKIMSGSMTPEYPIGTVVVVKKAEASQIGIGDVISFYSVEPTIVGKPNTHRVVAVEEIDGVLHFTTKGDANVIDDKYQVSAERIIGKVIGKTLIIEKLSNIRSNKVFFFLVIFIPMMVIIFLEVGSIQKKLRQQPENDKKDKTNEGKEN